jgi:signal peptide peptidase SppA
MKRYDRIISQCMQAPWAILPEKLAQIKSFLLSKQTAIEAFDPQESAVGIEAKARPSTSVKGSVAVMNLFGVLAPRMDMMEEMSGGTSTEKFGKAFSALVSDPSIKAIVINVDSPGGNVYGTQELAEIIFEARAQKHIVAIANHMAASAAYWVASAADEFVVTPSGEVGSIGVISVHEDWSEAYAKAGVKPTLIKAGEFKYEGNYFEPLSDDAKAAMQAKVDTYYDAFVGTVARNRGVTAKVVKSTFGQGRMMTASDAKAAGMVDRIDTLDGVLSRLGVSTASAAQTRMSHDVASKRLALAEL